jgi:hypothetical protein
MSPQGHLLSPLGFGVDDHPRCPHCNKPMYVAKRVRHPEYGAAYELQTLACICGKSFQRSIDEAGNSRD